MCGQACGFQVGTHPNVRTPCNDLLIEDDDAVEVTELLLPDLSCMWILYKSASGLRIRKWILLFDVGISRSLEFRYMTMGPQSLSRIPIYDDGPPELRGGWESSGITDDP